MPLAIVLHTHMPYVEGHGTWPFGEEWLWEAMASSYLPLLDVLERAPEVTLSLTPVLCDQLAAPGIGERFVAFLDDVRTVTHARDAESARAGGEEELGRELDRSAADYVRARERFTALGGDLVGALAPYAAWTSSATHAVLPLLATDGGVRLQVQTGIDAHRSRFGDDWRGGFWSPECAHDAWLDPLLDEAGVRATCVDVTDVFGMGAQEHLRPIASTAGPLLVPIDREVIELVWSDGGYPSRGAYRNTHRKTEHEHTPWRVDGRVYAEEDARAQARADAAEFVAHVRRRVAGGGLSVFAIDTELLGHWWYEGVWWLEAVVEECRAQGVDLVHLDDALTQVEPVPEPEGGLPATTWGRPRDLSTWDRPDVADLAWAARDAELRAVAAGPALSPLAARELLALQASDWAFVVSQHLAEPYGRERAAAHRAAFDALLAGGTESAARHLAPGAEAAPLLVP